MLKRSPLARLVVLLIVVITAFAVVAEADAQIRPIRSTVHASGGSHQRRTTKQHRRHHRRRQARHDHRPQRYTHPANEAGKKRKAKPTSAAGATGTTRAASPSGNPPNGGASSPAAGGSGSSAGGAASPTGGAASPTGGTGNPIAGDPFYVDPQDSAVTEENALLGQGNTSEAAQIERIASQPEAIWLTGDGTGSLVPGIMSAAASSGTVPVFVIYNIPDRDCGGYSSGGASGASDYESFINSVVSGLGHGKALVIVEPDALTYMIQGCLPSSDGQLIDYAVQQLDTDPNASVYVDAGNPGWESASSEANELTQVLGSTRAGFAVNVSNFVSTATDITYGTAISQATGGRHFVVDTSRNGGSVASGQWCNPAGAGIGADPTTATGNALVDAFLWVKGVGESDGTCNGGPSAGQFWLSYALSLVANG